MREAPSGDPVTRLPDRKPQIRGGPIGKRLDLSGLEGLPLCDPCPDGPARVQDQARKTCRPRAILDHRPGVGANGHQGNVMAVEVVGEPRRIETLPGEERFYALRSTLPRRPAYLRAPRL